MLSIVCMCSYVFVDLYDYNLYQTIKTVPQNGHDQLGVQFRDAEQKRGADGEGGINLCHRGGLVSSEPTSTSTVAM